MPDNEIRVLQEESWEMDTCPVLLLILDEDAAPCDQPLRVIATKTIVGDDYGDWATYDVDFECGHTLKQMKESLQHDV